MFDPNFKARMTTNKKEAWVSLKEVVSNYKLTVAYMTDPGCLMSLKVHFIHNHLDCFPITLGDVRETQREQFHQDINKIEKRY